LGHPLEAAGFVGVPLADSIPNGLLRCGIYALWVAGDATGRAYVGQSVDIRRRVRGHREHLCRGNHSNAFLQAVFAQQRDALWVWCVLVEVPRDKAALCAAEQQWMDWVGYDTSYNLARTAGTILGHRHSAETVAKMVATRADPEYRAKLVARCAAMSSSPEAREALRERAAAQWANPEYRAKQCAQRQRTHTTPEFRRTMSVAISALSTPESRAANTARVKQWAADHPEKVAATAAKARERARSPEFLAASLARLDTRLLDTTRTYNQRACTAYERKMLVNRIAALGLTEAVMRLELEKS
jgi:GIY-YIG catalytic domain